MGMNIITNVYTNLGNIQNAIRTFASATFSLKTEHLDAIVDVFVKCESYDIFHFKSTSKILAP